MKFYHTSLNSREEHNKRSRKIEEEKKTNFSCGEFSAQDFHTHNTVAKTHVEKLLFLKFVKMKASTFSAI